MSEKDNEWDDNELDDYDYCWECSGLGDDYYIDEDGELQCYCSECSMNPANWEE